MPLPWPLSVGVTGTLRTDATTKRDVALGEDACRTRKAAQTLAALRNLLLGFLHVLGVPVLRSLRRFAVNPMPLYRWLMGCI